ncbi:hypothetical protein FA13DRAFT_1739796 [Coprinellus micaceus]|uniref:Uncharacterized protein n=1 Tax=Coprinellus micaceus TaxID=71717 RepID=A0A4Y7SPL0_COPMI|nr:hypothetical protein FA13DRAFT_1739796 [Coprinellus micaceus]
MNDKTTSALQALVSVVETPESLAIHVTTGGINDILVVVGQGWTNITQVTLSGGSLTLQDFQLKDVEGGQGLPAVPLRFTTSVKKLKLDRSFTLWPFFGAHFLPGRGFANIEELCIREKFSWQEKGIRVMHECVRKLEGVPTLKLEAIYDNSPHLMEDMKAVFYNAYSRQRLPLVKIRGLSRLQLHLADVPAELALNCIGMYCLYLPATNVGVTVEIEVPRSADLWDNSDPSSHFPLLVVRGFPGTLPAEVGASGRAVVCGYPVVFMASRGEGAGM